MRYEPGLNQGVALQNRLREVFSGARRLHLAYARFLGNVETAPAGTPAGSRAVVDLDFGISDRLAVVELKDAGIDVRGVTDGAVSASTFNPKLYFVERAGELRRSGVLRTSQDRAHRV